MQSYMEIIYIDSEDLARHTDMRKACATNAITLSTFRAYRRFEVDIKSARFLLDYHNARGDLSDTIPIDATGFRAITGNEPKSETAYRKMDADFWEEVRATAKAA